MRPSFKNFSVAAYRRLLTAMRDDSTVALTSHGHRPPRQSAGITVPRNALRSVLQKLNNPTDHADLARLGLADIDFAWFDHLWTTRDTAKRWASVDLQYNALTTEAVVSKIEQLSIVGHLVAGTGIEMDFTGNGSLLPFNSAVWDYCLAHPSGEVRFSVNNFPGFVSAVEEEANFSQCQLDADTLDRLADFLVDDYLSLAWTLRVDGNCSPPSGHGRFQFEALIDQGWDVFYID